MKETLFESLFDKDLLNSMIFADAKSKKVEPRTSIYSKNGTSIMTLVADLPGYNKNNISVITYQNSVIAKSEKSGHKGESIMAKDIKHPFIHEEVTGSIKDGVLTVTLPLRADAGTVKINIT